SRSSARSATPRCYARSPRTAARVRLICVADPRQGWDPLLSQLFGLVPAHVPGAVDRSRGRGGAPTAQRGRTTLSVLRTPVKVGIRCCLSCLASFRHTCLGRWTAVGVEVERP